MKPWLEALGLVGVIALVLSILTVLPWPFVAESLWLRGVGVATLALPSTRSPQSLCRPAAGIVRRSHFCAAPRSARSARCSFGYPP